jgi:predicted RNA methylase
VSGRRAGQRFDAVHGVTTEALVFLGELDPDAIGLSLEFATHYEPTPVAEAEALLDGSPLRPEQATFVDVGAGMGRVVLLAARRSFRRVLGIEISPALVEIARDNIASAHGAQRAAKDVRVVAADAASFAFPRGDLVVYMYNPFRAPVLERMLTNLLAADDAREIVLLYHTAVEHETIDGAARFEVVADLGFGLVYRLRH